MPAWKFLLAATIAVAACSPPAAAQGELGTPIGIPETERVSFELENALRQENIQFPSAVPDSERGLGRGQIMVGAWMRSHSREIAGAEGRFGVTRQAIAGVIAWEALKNVAPLSVRSVGPGKVHICNMTTTECLAALSLACGGVSASRCPESVKGIDETVGQEVEALGYLPPTSLRGRVEALSTSSGAITYIGAILRAGADAAREAGWDIDNNPAKLAEFYRGFTVRRWKLALQRVPRDSEKLILRDGNGNEIVDEMGEWIEQNKLYLESAIGASELRAPSALAGSILGSLPAGAADARRNAQARNDDYESWLRRLEATISRAEEVRRQEKEEIEFNKELYRQAGSFGYLATAAGLACSDPGAFVAEVNKGRYSSVGMESRYLSAYLGVVSQGSSLCPPAHSKCSTRSTLRRDPFPGGICTPGPANIALPTPPCSSASTGRCRISWMHFRSFHPAAAADPADQVPPRACRGSHETDPELLLPTRWAPDRAAICAGSPAEVAVSTKRGPAQASSVFPRSDTVARCISRFHRRSAEGAPVIHPAPALTGEELQALLGRIITGVLRLLTREGHLVEDEGVTNVADAHGIIDPDNLLAPLQAAACTYRIAFGPRAGRKVLSLHDAASRAAPMTQPLCAKAHGFSLHAGVRCGAEQRGELEHLCRYITRPAIANERQLWKNATD